MNSDNGIESEATSSTPPTDTSGKPVEKNLEDSATPPSTQTKEQEAEELSRKIAEIERKVADGH
ncbi:MULTISPECIES: hypothetical protein [unclassified Pseudomonas]|jgi:hypothetical protein|uniref:hypothetical protein n=1 Tax=unclassified Pseudomonas TaxID=196821 RepID=UPI0009538E92|nr:MULTISPECIES: hypothetical protein [unclassified Pseudomonas]MDD2030632.1 hypothetical protein [Pseudomonas sp. 39167]SIR93523.1 hypothetical protein SAMN05216504_3087 [Pseudomonas sp. A214]